MLKDDLQAEIDLFVSMPVRIYTFYKKWLELQEYSKKRNLIEKDKERLANFEVLKSFFKIDGDENDVEILNPVTLEEVKQSIWVPDTWDDYLKIQPMIVVVDSKELLDKWQNLVYFMTTGLTNPIPGRNIKFIVFDKPTRKILGFICVSSDFLDLGRRDESIGWTREQRSRKTHPMTRHTAIGSTIVPTQPLGFNYTGGKLMTLLMISDEVENAWNNKYGDKLVGFTTTALYGGFSQYSGLKYWKSLGESSGSVSYEPSKELELRCKDWLKEHHPEKFNEFWIEKRESGMPLKRNHRQRSLQYVYKKLGITKYTSGFKRGVYFCQLFEKTKEFLREGTTDPGNKMFDNSVGALVELWKEKYAAKRIQNLIKDNKADLTTLFYDKVLYSDSWKDAKEFYLRDDSR